MKGYGDLSRIRINRKLRIGDILIRIDDDFANLSKFLVTIRSGRRSNFKEDDMTRIEKAMNIRVFDLRTMTRGLTLRRRRLSYDEFDGGLDISYYNRMREVFLTIDKIGVNIRAINVTPPVFISFRSRILVNLMINGLVEAMEEDNFGKDIMDEKPGTINFLGIDFMGIFLGGPITKRIVGGIRTYRKLDGCRDGLMITKLMGACDAIMVGDARFCLIDDTRMKYDMDDVERTKDGMYVMRVLDKGMVFKFTFKSDVIAGRSIIDGMVRTLIVDKKSTPRTRIRGGLTRVTTLDSMFFDTRTREDGINPIRKTLGIRDFDTYSTRVLSLVRVSRPAERDPV